MSRWKAIFQAPLSKKAANPTHKPACISCTTLHQSEAISQEAGDDHRGPAAVAGDGNAICG